MLLEGRKGAQVDRPVTQFRRLTLSKGTQTHTDTPVRVPSCRSHEIGARLVGVSHHLVRIRNIQLCIEHAV